jgi:predicted nucleic acid-binding protein
MDGATLVAPSLLAFELANVCVTKCRHTPQQAEAFAEAFAARSDLAIDEIDVDHGGVVDVALETGLSGHDATYLWVSRFLGAELVTLDRKLARAAGQSLP